MQRDAKIGRLGAALALALVGALCGRGWAQDQPAPPRPADDAEWRAQIEARMRQLEQENPQVRRQVGEVAPTQQALMRRPQVRRPFTLGIRPEQTTPEFFDLNKYAAEGDF